MWHTIRKRLSIRYALISAGLCCLLGIIFPPHCVKNDDMYPNISKRAIVFSIHPSLVNTTASLEQGDIILYRHPVFTNHLLLTRVLATPGQSIQYQNDSFSNNHRVLTQVDMRVDDEEHRIYQEKLFIQTKNKQTAEKNWFIRQRNQASLWQSTLYTVPDAHIFVACDNRFYCVDSRWFGPISQDTVQYKILVSIDTSRNFLDWIQTHI